MPTILITNDDGIHSAGLHVLAEALMGVGDVQIIAPDRERSAVSHSFSMNHPIRARRTDEHTTIIDGTPTDCVMFGMLGYLGDKRPDLVVSGINTGPNMGDDVTYSGTVAAALEATMLKAPSFAISMGQRVPYGTEYADRDIFSDAARFAVVVARDILSNGIPEGTFLNINVPRTCKGARVTKLGKRIYFDQVVKRIDPLGRDYYWIGGEEPEMVEDDGTDFKAVHEGYISVTPLRYDLTNYAALDEMEKKEYPLRSGEE